MLNLARWSTTHRKYVVVGWIVLLIAINALAQSAGTSYSNNFTLPNSDAQRAADLLQHSFPAQAGDRDTIVFKVSSGSVEDPAVRSRMTAMFAQVRRLPHVSSVVSPYEGAGSGRSVSANRQIAFATVVFDKKANLLPQSAPERVVSTARAAAQPGLQVELGGQAIEMTEQPGFGISTAVGLLAAIVVLLLTFGSLIAMGLPIVTALFGLGTGLGVIALFTHVVDTPNFSSELAAMIGLGVGIDYALFILTRFREAYRTPGPTFHDSRESVLRAIDTAGRAVLFAGTTVVIALLGMMLLGVDFLYGVAISASIGVLLVMLASLTLLPALLTISGHKVARPSRRARRRGEEQAPQLEGTPAAGAWLRWSRFVGERPATIAVVAALVMLAIAAPAIALRLGSSDASNDPASQTTHKAYELLAEGFGEGFNGPLLVVSQAPSRQSVEALASAVSGDPGRRLDRAAAVQPERRQRRHDHRLPALLAAGLRDDEARRRPARRRRAAARAQQRDQGLRRRRDRRRGRLRDHARAQAAAVHRRRRAALGAAAADRVPLAGDPAAGGGDEPAQHRRRARRDRRRLPVGLARGACSASRRGRSSRSSR